MAEANIEDMTKVNLQNKIIALWAFSEATLGGILYISQVPFKGLVMSSASVILISLLVNYSSRRGDIIKATLFVVLIKALISPYAAPTAYIAITFQGILGEVIYFNRKVTLLRALLFGIIVTLQSGFQRIIVLTLIYGENLWNSVNAFIAYLVKSFDINFIESNSNFAIALIGFYLSMHLVGGAGAGFLAYRFPINIKKNLANSELMNNLRNLELNHELSTNKIKKKHRKLKPMHIVTFTFFIVVLLLTYFAPLFANIEAADIIIMMIRAVLIILLWYFFLAPFVRTKFRNFLKKNQSKYADQIDHFMNFFPLLKRLINSTWNLSAGKKGFHKLSYFINSTIIYLLFFEND